MELFAGGVAGMTAWGACLPFDVVKTRLQSSKSGEAARWLPTLLNIVREEGAGALFSGALPVLSRAFFVNGITFYVYEEAMRWIS